MKHHAIFITGTDTGVGKTLITAGLVLALKQRGLDVGVMKPVATGATRIKNRLISNDTEFLLKSSAVRDERSLITPYCADLPLSPHIAFASINKSISKNKIINAFNALKNQHQLLLVEGIGGLLVPLYKDYVVADLVKDLGIPLLIVSRNSLGTINHTLLTIKQAESYNIPILGVIFNNQTESKKDISSKTNPRTTCNLGEVSLLGNLPYIKNASVEKLRIGDLLKQTERNIDLDLIIKRSINGFQKNNRYRKLVSSNKRYVWHPFTQMRDWLKESPLIIEEAKGSYLKDTNGKWFLDGVSSLWVNVHGHRRREIDQAIKTQLNKVAHSTLLGLANVPSIELAKELIDIAPKGLTKVFFSDNGSTSVEVALKMAFGYWQHKSDAAKKKVNFIYLDYSYHGDTIGSVSVGGIELFHKLFHPLLFNSFKADAPYCYRCPKGKTFPNCKFQCLDSLKNILKKHHQSVSALIIEPIVQCAGGMIVWPKGILKEMRRLCDKHNVLLIADEVAVGFGRSGKMFACEHEGVSPDILCLSKGLSAGYLPLAATLAKEKIYRAFLGRYADKKTFFHGHSYTGNPLACSAALGSLEVFRKESTLKKLKPKVEFLKKQLGRFKDLAHVGDVRQKGFIVGIELIKNKKTKQDYSWQDKTGIKVCCHARNNGLILRPLGNCIVLMPPLSISRQELKKILDITYEAIKTITE